MWCSGNCWTKSCGTSPTALRTKGSLKKTSTSPSGSIIPNTGGQGRADEKPPKLPAAQPRPKKPQDKPVPYTPLVRPETGHPSHTYGRYQNVFLTDEELADLQVSFPAVWEQYIEKLSEYMASTGKRYQSHAATIRRWAGEDAKKTVTPSRNRDYSVKEDETV